jgi:hypothetical protein
LLPSLTPLTCHQLHHCEPDLIAHTFANPIADPEPNSIADSEPEPKPNTVADPIADPESNSIADTVAHT